MRFKDISESQLEKFKKIGQWLDYVNSKANKDSTAEEIKELLKDSPTQEDSYAYQDFISKYKIVGMKDGEFICYGDHWTYLKPKLFKYGTILSCRKNPGI